MQPIGIALESKHCSDLFKNAELHSLAQQLPQNSQLVVGIPATEMLFQKITADQALSDDDLIVFLSSRLTQLFGSAAETLFWDYEKHSRNNQHEITVIAAQKTTIDSIKNTFQKYNIVIKAIEPTPFALARMLTEKEKCQNYYALIPAETDFIFVTVFQHKIFHCEKLSQSQLHQIPLMIPFNYPFYFVNTKNHSANFSYPEFITLKDTLAAQQVKPTTIYLNVNESLSTWKKQ